MYEDKTIRGVRNFALYPKCFLAKVEPDTKKFLGFYEPTQKIWVGKGKQVYIWNVEDIEDGVVALYTYGRLFYLSIKNGKVKEWDGD